MVQDSTINHLKEQIESEEMILKTKILDVRSQVSKKIEKAQQEADQDYQMKLKEIETKKADRVNQIELKFNKIIQGLEKAEDELFQEIGKKYEQREKIVIDKLLKFILP